MKVGDLVGYINGDGPAGIVLDIWSEQDGWYGGVSQMVKVLWSSGATEEMCMWNVEVISESR